MERAAGRARGDFIFANVLTRMQARSKGQAGLPMEQKLAATALAMQLRTKGILMQESHDRFSGGEGGSTL